MSWDSKTPHVKNMRIGLTDWPTFQQFLIIERGFSAKPKGLAIVGRRFRRLAVWFGDKDFTRAGVVEFLGKLHEQGLKNSYLNNFVKDAKLIDRFLGTNELRDFRFLREEPSIPKDLLSVNEIKTLADAKVPYRTGPGIINQRQRVLILLLGTTGCRIDEALSLKPSDIHDAPAHVTFRNTKNGDDRSVPISPEIHNLLLRLPHKGDTVFSLTAQSVNSDLKVRAKFCAIRKRVYCHLFRHSYITEMLNQGVEWFTLSKIVGHRDPKTTMGYYNQSIAEATKIIMQHPLLRPSLSFEQQAEMLKTEVRKIFNDKTARLTIQEEEGKLILKIKNKPS